MIPISGHNLRWLATIAVLMTIIVIAACGSDSTATPEPTATPVPKEGPAPSATPEPTATPVPPTSIPEPTEPPMMMMDDLIIGPGTTGQDLVAHISQPEAACLSGAMGDANFQLFQAAPITLAATQEGAYTLFATCLEYDTLLSLGIGLMGTTLGGWSDDALTCVTDVSGTHPEMIFLAMGVTEQVGADAHAGDIHAVLLDMYTCLDTREQAAFQVAMMANSLQAAPFSGQDFLDFIPDSEVECLQANLPGPVFAMIASAPSVAGGELSSAPPELIECISPESLGLLPIEIMSRGIGASSDESHACVIDFAAEHAHYIELVQRFSENAESLSPEEFNEIAEDGFELFSCLTDEELAMFQETFAPYLVP